jgi:RNA polymerase sigma-70 factor (ECF subfamily)
VTRDDDDEARLLHRIGAGDRRAFEILYRLYHPRLARFLSRQLKTPDLVEEVLNDTMLTLWRSADSFAGASKLSTWLFSIAYRKATRARSRFDEPVEDARSEDRPREQADSEEMLGRLQSNAVLRRAIATLSPDHRAVVDLTYFHEFGYKEIAEIMRCPVDTVKTRMFHARRKLKAALPGNRADWL